MLNIILIPIISLPGEVWAHKTCLTLSLFIEVPVLSQESERSCMCVRVSILLVYFGNVPTVWYLMVFHCNAFF